MIDKYKPDPETAEKLAKKLGEEAGKRPRFEAVGGAVVTRDAQTGKVTSLVSPSYPDGVSGTDAEAAAIRAKLQDTFNTMGPNNSDSN